MKKFNTITYSAIISATIMFAACGNQKEEDVFPPPVVCDTASVSFSAFVKPIIDAQCLSCHSLSLATAGVVLEQYSDFAPYTSSGRLVNSIQYNDSIVMPPAGKLPDCDIAKVRSWVRAGAPNN